ncbi:MAG: hypothetical protein CL471_17025 [Acidobacteria bacterium]|nr:hypothetical protein [Acidobacteriota bacterium]
MEQILITVTLLSLLVAIGMTLVAWRLLREERRRSAARIEMLVAERAAAARPESDADIIADWRRPDGADPRSAPPAALFAPTAPASSPAGLMLVIAAMVLVAGAGLSLIVVSGPASGPANSTAPITAAAALPLELLALDHARADGRLAISGSVRNPPTGVGLNTLVAAAVIFDRNGDLLSAAEAPVDQARLDPGEESVFQVSLPADRPVGRYRISFRQTDDTLVPHVDRRPPAAADREVTP